MPVLLHQLRRELLLAAIGFAMGAAPLLAAHGAAAKPPTPPQPSSILGASA